MLSSYFPWACKACTKSLSLARVCAKNREGPRSKHDGNGKLDCGSSGIMAKATCERDDGGVARIPLAMAAGDRRRADDSCRCGSQPCCQLLQPALRAGVDGGSRAEQC